MCFWFLFVLFLLRRVRLWKAQGEPPHLNLILVVPFRFCWFLLLVCSSWVHLTLTLSFSWLGFWNVGEVGLTTPNPSNLIFFSRL